MEKVHLIFPAETTYLEKIRDSAGDYARGLGFGREKIGDIQSSVDEAATNVIQHSYKDRPGLPADQRVIELDLAAIDNGIEIVISDRGSPFNPLDVPPPDLERYWAESRTHGLGIYAIRSFMDEIDHRYIEGKGNQFIMRKHINRGFGKSGK